MMLHVGARRRQPVKQAQTSCCASRAQERNTRRRRAASCAAAPLSQPTHPPEREQTNALNMLLCGRVALGQFARRGRSWRTSSTLRAQSMHAGVQRLIPWRLRCLRRARRGLRDEGASAPLARPRPTWRRACRGSSARPARRSSLACSTRGDDWATPAAAALPFAADKCANASTACAPLAAWRSANLSSPRWSHRPGPLDPRCSNRPPGNCDTMHSDAPRPRRVRSDDTQARAVGGPLRHEAPAAATRTSGGRWRSRCRRRCRWRTSSRRTMGTRRRPTRSRSASATRWVATGL